jgi:hypothetical protein
MPYSVPVSLLFLASQPLFIPQITRVLQHVLSNTVRNLIITSKTLRSTLISPNDIKGIRGTRREVKFLYSLVGVFFLSQPQIIFVQSDVCIASGGLNLHFGLVPEAIIPDPCSCQSDLSFLEGNARVLLYVADEGCGGVNAIIRAKVVEADILKTGYIKDGQGFQCKGSLFTHGS